MLATERTAAAVLPPKSRLDSPASRRAKLSRSFGLTQLTSLSWFYFLWWPVTFGFALGWVQGGTGRYMERWWSLAYWIPISIIRWYGEYIGTTIVHRVLAPWRPPVEVQLLFGLVVGAAVFLYPYRLYNSFLRELAGAPPQNPVPFVFSWDFLVWLFQVASAISALWFATNVFFERVLGIRRFSYEQAPAVEPIEPPEVPVTIPHSRSYVPPFAARLTTAKFSEIVALEAEDHYMRVHSSHGSELILYRLRDAVCELDPDIGIQTHRSFWVRRSAIKQLMSSKHGHSLVLVTDLRIPVSVSRLNQVKDAMARGSEAPLAPHTTSVSSPVRPPR